jgi:6-pyruvoyl-tetrahydropterin synthase
MHLFVEHLTVIDCAYLCPEHGLVGESWIADVTLTGALDAQSMVMDFAHVKKQLKALIDTITDHTLIVPAESANLTWEDKAKQRLRFEFGAGEIPTSLRKRHFA